METGNETVWMVMVYFHGRMGVFTKVNILTIKSTDMENSTGPMVKNTKAHGETESSTGWEHMLVLVVKRV